MNTFETRAVPLVSWVEGVPADEIRFVQISADAHSITGLDSTGEVWAGLKKQGWA